jgi:hypothetical protein
MLKPNTLRRGDDLVGVISAGRLLETKRVKKLAVSLRDVTSLVKADEIDGSVGEDCDLGVVGSSSVPHTFSHDAPLER